MKTGGLIMGIILMCISAYLFVGDVDVQIFFPIILGIFGLAITVMSIGLK